MTWAWTEFLEWAKEATGQKPKPKTERMEALWRTAISRAYYAAFCSARDVVIRQTGRTFRPDQENVHTEVRDEFFGSPDKATHDIGLKLGRLRNYRNMADYDAQVPGHINVGKAAFRMADEIVAALPNARIRR